MSGGAEKMNNAFSKALKRTLKMQVVAGKVTAVDENNHTCDVAPADGGAYFFDVRLRAAIGEGDYGTVIIPKVGSQVLIGLIGNNDQQCFVCGFSEVERVYTLAEGRVQVFGETLELNGDEFTTLKGGELLEQVNKANDRLEALITTLNSWTPVVNDGGGALKTLIGTAFTGKPQADFSNLENEKVKHGGGN